MFRALLWKESRELWMLPAVAVPLAAMSFFVIKMVFRQPTPYVWDSSFAMWLIVAAIYIPTHLFVRGKETDTFAFLISRPLDRFRLWWFWLFAGVATLVVTGAALCLVTDALTRVYFGDGTYDAYRARVITASLVASLAVFSLSMLMSAIFRRQINAIAAVFLVFSIVPVFWILAWLWPSEVRSIISFSHYTGFRLMGRYYLSNPTDLPLVFSLIVCPILLFSSLAIFAKGSVWKSSRTAIAKAYGFAAFIALISMSLGFSHLSHAKPRRIHRGGYSGLRGVRVSEDGSRVSMYAGGKRVALDLSSKKLIEPVPEKYYKYDRPVAGGETLEFDRRAGFYGRNYQRRVTIRDSLKTWKRRLKGGSWSQRRHYSSFYRLWSVGGEFVAVFERPSEETGEDGYLAIMDRDGAVVGRKMFPLFEGDLLTPIGWGYDSRFYYAQTTKPRNPRTTCYRVTPQGMASEKVAGLSLENYSFDSMSPDGRWILAKRRLENADQREVWAYDISQKKLQHVGTSLSGFWWSPDSSMLVYRAPASRRSDIKQWKETLSRPMVYRLDSEKSFPLTEEAVHEFGIDGWSPSGKHLLGVYSTLEIDIDAWGNPIGGSVFRKHRVTLSVETPRMIEIDDPFDRALETYTPGRRKPAWILGDRLLWHDKTKMIATEPDASNPQEILRVEGGKLYLYGEEQS